MTCRFLLLQAKESRRVIESSHCQQRPHTTAGGHRASTSSRRPGATRSALHRRGGGDDESALPRGEMDSSAARDTFAGLRPLYWGLISPNTANLPSRNSRRKTSGPPAVAGCAKYATRTVLVIVERHR